MSAPAIRGCAREGAQMVRFGMKNRRAGASHETGLFNRRVSGGCADHPQGRLLVALDVSQYARNSQQKVGTFSVKSCFKFRILGYR